MSLKKLILPVFILWAYTLQAQTYRTLSFMPCLGKQSIPEGAYISYPGTDSIQFTRIRFYISGVELYHKNTCTWKEPGSYHLMDLFDPKRSSLQIPDLPFDKIRFYLGLDSLTNTSGALSGDLDPTIGMYWAWQSGYIHIKVEGKLKQCSGREKEFTYHLGGYLFPNASIRSLELNTKGMRSAKVLVDMAYLLSSISVCDQKDVMSPGPMAMELSTLMAGCFKMDTYE